MDHGVSIENGHLQPAYSRSTNSTTQTDFGSFCKAVLAPRLRQELTREHAIGASSKRHLIAASIAIIGVVTITKLVERVRADVVLDDLDSSEIETEDDLGFGA